MRLRLFSALAFATLVAACGGGDSTPTPPPSTTITGVVFDEAIAGATVSATSLDTGEVIGTAVTADDGRYSISAPTANFGSGFLLRSSGGKMNGVDFADSLAAIYATNAIPAQANATLLTTALVDAANKTTAFTGTTLQKHESLKTAGIARGVIPLDYAAVSPVVDTLPRMQNDAAAIGVSAAVAPLANLLAAPAKVKGCGATDDYCTKDMGESRSFSIKLASGASVQADLDEGAKNCRVTLNYNAAEQVLTAQFESIPDLISGFNPQLLCKLTGSVKLALPPISGITGEARDACLPPEKRIFEIPYCVTVGSGISPSYHFDDGTYRHRTGKATQEFVGNGKVGVSLKLSRGYGANLHASQVSQAEAEDPWEDKTAIILVHGYALGGRFGGGSETWGRLPTLITENDKVVVLEFRWITDASYITVAPELAKAVAYAYERTGRKVHIVAHSFGGVLSRVMLQNLPGDPALASAAAMVQTLTTVGTPHSGISSSEGLVVKDIGLDITLPKGWGTLVPGSRCEQATCYQSGLDADVATWAKEELAEEIGAANIPSRGYINARLAKTAIYPFPAGLKVSVLIGAPTLWPTNVVLFDASDYLITTNGQRFEPSASNGFPAVPLKDLMTTPTNIGGALVTERVLGLRSDLKQLSSALPLDLSAYARSHETAHGVAQWWGYSHAYLPLIAKPGVGPAEVAIPEICGSAATCQHDTWLNIKEVLAENPAECKPPQVLQGDVCVDAPVVSNVTPSAASAGVSTTFAVTGDRLPLIAVLSLQDGTCDTPTNRTSTGFTVSCMPGGSGVKTVSVLAADGGAVIDASRTVTVSAGTQTNAFYETFDGTALDASKWTGVNLQGVPIDIAPSGSLQVFGSSQAAWTKGKVTFSGGKIVVEARMQGAGSSHEAAVALVEDDANSILLHETTYAAWGFAANGYGRYNFVEIERPFGVGAAPQNATALGGATTAWMEYRLTLEGNKVTMERGPTLSDITQTATRTLGASVAGRTFYLLLNAGVSPYAPAVFDWVRVTVTP